MTAREWLETPDGQKRMREQAEILTKRFEPDIKFLSERVRETQESLQRVVKNMNLAQVFETFNALNQKEVVAILPVVSKPVHLDEASIRALLANGRKSEKVKNPFIEYRDGNFYTLNKLIDIRDPRCAYGLVIKALLLKSDESGFLSYDKINKYLEHNGILKVKNKKAQRKRIANTLASLKREHKRQENPFPMELPNGSPVIRTVPGKGLMITR